MLWGFWAGLEEVGGWEGDRGGKGGGWIEGGREGLCVWGEGEGEGEGDRGGKGGFFSSDGVLVSVFWFLVLLLFLLVILDFAE